VVSAISEVGSIPLLDLGRLHRSIAAELHEAITDVVDRSAFVGAESCRSFEEAFAAAHHRRAAAGCGSGTEALALALRALGVGEGDEVIVPAMTFVATLEAVVHVGATPVIADVDPVSLLLTPQSVEAVRSSRTVGVVPVHLYGHVVPLDHITSWRDAGLIVVEDAAQAHLATWQGRGVGAGHAACFSFYPGKNLGALGDGGAVVSDDETLVGEVKRLRDHGRHSKYEHDVIGWCSRLDGLQARVLEVKLRHLARWTEARQTLADRYRSSLGDLLVGWEEGAVHHLLVVRVAGGERDRVARDLKSVGVETGIHYPVPLSRQQSCLEWATPCRNAETAAQEVLSLPMDPLMSADDVDRVADEFVRLVEQ
jgi:dTDP-4-amino-4,6-dideoxygalactose transaminase